MCVFVCIYYYTCMDGLAVGGPGPRWWNERLISLSTRLRIWQGREL